MTIPFCFSEYAIIFSSMSKYLPITKGRRSKPETENLIRIKSGLTLSD